jgi:uncharacterized BrkB/YihY/UPF0761 family membrane protein
MVRVYPRIAKSLIFRTALTAMIRQSAAPSLSHPARRAFHRKLAMIWAIGTLLPLAMLALLYVLAPLPMTTATLDILRTANRFAGTVVLLHWGITLAVWVASKVVKPAQRQAAGWQSIKQVRHADA